MEEQNQLDNFFNISFDGAARNHMKQIAMWAKICALCAFVSYAVSLALALFGHKDFSAEAEGFSFGFYVRAGNSIIGVLITIIIGGIMNYFLFKFSVAASQGVESMDSGKLNEGLNSLRTYYKIYGILVIIALGIVALGIIVFSIAAAFSGR